MFHPTPSCINILFVVCLIIILVLLQPSLATAASSCASTPNGQTYSSDWGPAPSSSEAPYFTITCLSVTNDKAYPRPQEVAYSGIPLSQNLNVLTKSELQSKFVLVGANNRRIPCQFEIISRWTGPVTDTSKPIRWVQVVVPLMMTSGNSVSTFELRQYTTSQTTYPNQDDDLTISSSNSGNTHIISTGEADFTIDETIGSLISKIEMDNDTILNSNTINSNNSPGVSLTFIPQQTTQYGSSPRTITSQDDASSVDYFEITENGPIKAVVMIEGTLSDPSGASLCNTFGSYYVDPYESFTYSLSLSFFRKRSDFKVQFHIRNQCSNGDGSDWTDQSFLINQASYTLDFSSGIDETIFSSHYYGGNSISSMSNGISSGSNVVTIVEQQKGSANNNNNSSWLRRARVRSNGSPVETSEYYDAPFLALSDGAYLVGTTLSNMKYREPQALRLNGSSISIDVISEQQRVGEGKGIWNHAMFVLRSVNSGTSNVIALLQSLRWPALLEVGMNKSFWFSYYRYIKQFYFPLNMCLSFFLLM